MNGKKLTISKSRLYEGSWFIYDPIARKGVLYVKTFDEAIEYLNEKITADRVAIP